MLKLGTLRKKAGYKGELIVRTTTGPGTQTKFVDIIITKSDEKLKMQLSKPDEFRR